MIESLLQLDEQLFYFINNGWSNPVLDAIMPYWRNKYVWIPCYVALAGWLIWKFRQKGAFLLLALILTVGIADTTSSRLVKKSVQRLRPCNDPGVKDQVQLLIRCGVGYSFTSSHATNHFAVATFLCFTLGILYRKIRWPLWLWALSIALGQVYVGVHYPLDILFGGLLGSLIGWGVANIYRQFPAIDLTKDAVPVA